MPYSVDEKHSPSEFYYLGETNDPYATFQGEDNAEQNSNKNSQEKVFSGLFYKFRKIAIQQSHNGKVLPSVFIADLAPSSLGLYENLRQYFPVQTEQTRLISPYYSHSFKKIEKVCTFALHLPLTD